MSELWSELREYVPYVAGAVVVALILIVAVWKRHQSHARYCRAKGFAFEGPTRTTDPVPDVFELIDPKRDGQWFARIRGEWNRAPFTAQDYYWDQATASGAGAVAVMLWEIPHGVSVPAFRLVPEGMWDRIKQHFGAPDIDYANDPEFSRAYRLEGQNELAVRALFTPGIREFLTAHPGQRVGSDGRHLIWWTPPGFLPNALPKVSRIERFFDRGDAVRRLFWS
jgi:hypothetical protein